MYVILFLTGAIGFFAMAALGITHGITTGNHAGSTPLGHGHGGHGLNHGGAVRTASPHASANHAGSGHTQAAPSAARSHSAPSGKGMSRSLQQRGLSTLLMFLSPLDIFALCLGGGATGELLRHLLSGRTLALAAVAGALVFDFGIAKQIIRFLGRFITIPSDGLEGRVACLGKATTNFDAKGKGIISLELDGQLTQLLATLDSTELERGCSVAKGQQVLVLEVDSRTNTCRVSREFAPPLADAAITDTSQVRLSS